MSKVNQVLKERKNYNYDSFKISEITNYPKAKSLKIDSHQEIITLLKAILSKLEQSTPSVTDETKTK